METRGHGETAGPPQGDTDFSDAGRHRRNHIQDLQNRVCTHINPALSVTSNIIPYATHKFPLIYGLPFPVRIAHHGTATSQCAWIRILTAAGSVMG